MSMGGAGAWWSALRKAGRLRGGRAHLRVHRVVPRVSDPELPAARHAPRPRVGRSLRSRRPGAREDAGVGVPRRRRRHDPRHGVAAHGRSPASFGWKCRVHGVPRRRPQRVGPGVRRARSRALAPRAEARRARAAPEAVHGARALHRSDRVPRVGREPREGRDSRRRGRRAFRRRRSAKRGRSRPRRVSSISRGRSSCPASPTRTATCAGSERSGARSTSAASRRRRFSRA